MRLNWSLFQMFSKIEKRFAAETASYRWAHKHCNTDFVQSLQCECKANNDKSTLIDYQTCLMNFDEIFCCVNFIPVVLTNSFHLRHFKQRRPATQTAVPPLFTMQTPNELIICHDEQTIWIIQKGSTLSESSFICKFAARLL